MVGRLAMQLSKYAAALRRLSGHMWIAPRAQALPNGCGTAWSAPLHSSTSLPNATPVELVMARGRKTIAHACPKTIPLHTAGLEGPPRRLAIKGKARHSKLDAPALSRRLTAFCAAEHYDLPTAKELFNQLGFNPAPVATGLESEVLHVQVIADTPSGTTMDRQHQGRGDAFVFPSGSVVMWNISPDVANSIVNGVLTGAAEKPISCPEAESFAYVEIPDSRTSELIGDTIYLGIDTESVVRTSTDGGKKRHVDTTLAQIAYSSALARSTKLAVLEELLSSYFRSTRDIPSTLSSGAALPFTRSFILRKTGELLGIRAQLNLYSELTDSLPDQFWDSPLELGLEEYYESLSRALDVGVRIKNLNQKMDYASEIAAVLRERLSEKHSTGLEWLIIGLISIEVAFGIFHLMKEEREQEDLRHVRQLLVRYLDMEIAGKDGKHD